MQVLQCHLRGKAGFLRCNKSRLESEIDRLRANKHIYTHLSPHCAQNIHMEKKLENTSFVTRVNFGLRFFYVLIMF